MDILSQRRTIIVRISFSNSIELSWHHPGSSEEIAVPVALPVVLPMPLYLLVSWRSLPGSFVAQCTLKMSVFFKPQVHPEMNRIMILSPNLSYLGIHQTRVILSHFIIPENRISTSSWCSVHVTLCLCHSLSMSCSSLLTKSFTPFIPQIEPPLVIFSEKERIYHTERESPSSTRTEYYCCLNESLWYPSFLPSFFQLEMSPMPGYLAGSFASAPLISGSLSLHETINLNRSGLGIHQVYFFPTDEHFENKNVPIIQL